MLTKEQEAVLAALRGRLREYMGMKRLCHTLAVEDEIAALSDIYCPSEEFQLRVSALLHDITKELAAAEQLSLCDKIGIPYTDEEKLTPKIFHAKTAGVIIKRDFPEYADLEAVASIRWHTTGRRGMNLFDKLLYLADWIEATRTFELCLELRKYFYDGLSAADTEDERAALLENTLIKALDMTIETLISEGEPIHTDTISARNHLVTEKKS